MSQTPRKSPAKSAPAAASGDTPSGDRIAKVIARAGVASRRDAEKIINAGRVSVNGKVIDSPALNVTAKDKIVVDGKPLNPPEPPRMWMYHKPTGLVTSNSDEKGRATIFDALPADLPRVMTVGRLDLNSEGLLLLTNDGDLKRQLELPSTGWLRRYRVRVNGRVTETALDPLRKGIVADGEHFLPMDVTLDRQQGANAWLTIGLREGKNREIRRALSEIGFSVNRLIRVSYGPFQLGNLKEGAVEEIRRKVLRDQLGLEIEEPQGTTARPGTKVSRNRKPAAPRATDLTDMTPHSKRGKPAGKPAPRSGGKFAQKGDGKPAFSGRGAKPAQNRSRPATGGAGKPPRGGRKG
ncbi:MAG: pseudouridine synthase [Paracoccaceae bacterium]